ncbi:gustatory receptor for sugar taste 43a-like [Vespula squamosa]|uniref:Gustatory receptor for sugar taste 43a-like n=1 Tax=Vespula squamosa TaxID=30214 RepID=A0ABD2AXZ6_VESSQ
MLTTSLDSPQHKKVLRMKDNWEHDSSLSTIYRTYKTNENLAKLKKVKQIHLELMKCTRIINEAYGLQILASILYSTLILNKYHSWIREFCKHFYWIFFFVIQIFAISNICETTMTKIRDFTFQLIQNHLTFTACGFYDIDHTFIYNAIGSITTYLVILIQIGDKPNVLFDDMNYNSTLITE